MASYCIVGFQAEQDYVVFACESQVVMLYNTSAIQLGIGILLISVKRSVERIFFHFARKYYFAHYSLRSLPTHYVGLLSTRML